MQAKPVQTERKLRFFIFGGFEVASGTLHLDKGPKSSVVLLEVDSENRAWTALVRNWKDQVSACILFVSFTDIRSDFLSKETAVCFISA